MSHWGIISFCVSFGTISYYLAKGIVKNGKEVRTQIANNDQLAKQIDELVEESKRVVGDNIIGEGRYGGKILSKVELDDWAKLLKKKFGTNLEKVNSFDNPNILAQFDANTNTIRYKDDVTEYFMVHESFHAEEMKLISFDKYVKDAPLKGTKFPDGFSDENLLRSYKREKYVYEKILINAKKYNFTNAEMLHNLYNRDLYISLLRKRGFNIEF